MSSERAADDPGPVISLTEAADELGLHYMTVYRYVRTGRLYGQKRRGQWWVQTADVEDLKAGVATAPLGAASGGAVRDGSAPARANLVEPFTERLLVGDAGGCWAIVTDALHSGAAPADVHISLLQPALVDIGQRWADGLITISAEHRATATAQRLLGRLGPLFCHPGRRRGTVVLAMVAGDPHAMPSAILADLIADQHFDVVDLGANTPVESIVDTAHDCDDLIAIGVAATLVSLAPVLVETMRELQGALPGTPLFSGGPVALAHRGAIDAYADAIGADAAETALLVSAIATQSDT